MIRRTDNLDNLLDITTLELGSEYVKICYLHHVKEGRTEGTNSGFFRMYLKDVNGNVIVARLFNVASYEEKGLVILALKGKPVKVHFRVDAYNGSLNLIVNSVEYYDGVFEYASFIGKYEGTNRSYDFALNAFRKLLSSNENRELPMIYKTSSLRSIYEGRVGAYTFILEKVLLNIIALKEIPSINMNQMAEIFYMVQDVYYQYLKRVEDLDLVPLAEKLKFVSKFSTMGAGDNTLIATEVFSALIGLGKAETLVGIMLYDYINETIKHLNLLCIHQTMVSGIREVGGQQLVKY